MTWVVRSLVGKIRSILTANLTKRTAFWKMFKIKQGTYETSVRRLHSFHSDVVQASLHHPSHTRAPGDYLASKLHARSLKMGNIFHYEADIERCNDKLLQVLARYADTEETVKLSDPLASYAYDVMYATTTGQKPGFLERPIDAARIRSAMQDWKFYAVVHGTYVRFHPIIARLLKSLPLPDPSTQIRDLLPTDIDTVERGALRHVRERANAADRDDSALLFACAALITVGSSPFIIHALTSLFHIYRNPNLLQRLRHEIDHIQISWSEVPAEMQGPATAATHRAAGVSPPV
ncbi:hypothetical protein LTR53_015182 [Teratosphaeriaceae sp. CCFEE 6253]|nr:hypothetical protein LTR53_015182 [Teratosphaeriaceae sp. CCFEE 6253]